MKCSNCGHDRSWHLSVNECLFPESHCDCTGFEGTFSHDFLALFYFTMIGSILCLTGIVNMLFAFSEAHNLPVKLALASVTIVLGVFFLTYMNYRSQKTARILALDAK